MDLEKSRQIMKDKKKFDLISYLIFLKSLPDDQREPKSIIETCHNRFKHKFVSKHSFDGCKLVNLKFDKDNKFGFLERIGITKDPEGKQLIRDIGEGDLEDDNGSDDEDNKDGSKEFYSLF